MSETSTKHIIEVKGLTKVFPNGLKAVDNLSFCVDEGEILGLLGPNGAGKTTTLNMLSTLLKPSSGTASLNGYDVIKQPDGVRQSIGFVFQDMTLDNELTGAENLDFHGRIYGLSKDVRQKRIKEILDIVQLSDRAKDLAKTYSGGMKRRLEIARGLLHYPKVLFLDEPTLGLDPTSRRAIWNFIQRLNVEEKVTIILTTHYTEEADQLCGRIQIIDKVKIVALGTPERLKALLEGDIVSLQFENAEAIQKIRPVLQQQDWIRRIDEVATCGDAQAEASLPKNPGALPVGINLDGTGTFRTQEKPTANVVGGQAVVCTKRLNILLDNGARRIPEIVKLVDHEGVVLASVELHKPSLDDVFLSVTGRQMRDEVGSRVEELRRRKIVLQARNKRVRS